MKDIYDYEFPALVHPISGNFGDPHLPMSTNDNEFEIPNSEGKEMKCKYRRPKTVAVYCSQCSHHVIVPARADENFSQARVETCANCLGTGGRCKKCDEQNRVRRQRTVAA